MEQTAVMIVENKVEAEATALFDGELTFSEFMYNINKHFNRAKEMENEQKEKFWTNEEVLRIIQECKSYLSFGDEFNEFEWFNKFKK